MPADDLKEDAARGLLVGEGFPGQRNIVLTSAVVRAALTRPGTADLLVTDSGYFPNARNHMRARVKPIDQSVVLICVRGRGWCQTPEGRFEVEPGQVAVLPAHTPHAYGAQDEDPWTLWWLHVTGKSAEALVGLVGASPSAPVRVPADVPTSALLAAEVVAWMERDTTGPSLLAASGAAWHLLTLLASSFSVRDSNETLVERAAEHLRSTISSRTSVAELASTAGLSASYFAALFRKRFGVPVHAYQSQLRMARARELLLTTSRSIAQVAHECGYDDAAYFSRQFRTEHGASPQAYRRQND